MSLWAALFSMLVSFGVGFAVGLLFRDKPARPADENEQHWVG